MCLYVGLCCVAQRMANGPLFANKSCISSIDSKLARRPTSARKKEQNAQHLCCLGKYLLFASLRFHWLAEKVIKQKKK